MKAVVVTDQAAGTAGMTLIERPEPQAAINDVVVQVAWSLASQRPARCPTAVGPAGLLAIVALLTPFAALLPQATQRLAAVPMG